MKRKTVKELFGQCSYCQGTGKIGGSQTKLTCPHCGGTGVILLQREVTIEESEVE